MDLESLKQLVDRSNLIQRQPSAFRKKEEPLNTIELTTTLLQVTETEVEVEADILRITDNRTGTPTDRRMSIFWGKRRAIAGKEPVPTGLNQEEQEEEEVCLIQNQGGAIGKSTILWKIRGGSRSCPRIGQEKT